MSLIIVSSDVGGVNSDADYDLEISSGKDLVKELPVYEFDLRQYKTSFDDWNVAFENSIRKRAFGLRESIFICLLYTS